MWVAHLDVALFSLLGRAFTIKDVVLIAGGLFLLAKGTTEIHGAIEDDAAEAGAVGRTASFIAVMTQIGFINIIFSLDSVITAVGMTDNLPVMIAAVVGSTLVMLFAAKPVGDFIHRRPTTKMLALSFILLIGIALVADGLGFHLPRAYLYFAIAFRCSSNCSTSRGTRRDSERACESGRDGWPQRGVADGVNLSEKPASSHVFATAAGDKHSFHYRHATLPLVARKPGESSLTCINA